jgi:2-dehydro-3-deoxyglucarate aldolase/4-hydroxy-2-oxoheptanedioate aldolase
MDLPVNQFKRALREGRTIFGAWLMSGAPSTAEALGCAGFDFLVVDMEHVPVDTPQMIEILRTLEGTPAPGVVRLPWNDMVMIKRALDGGAQSVMLPFVQNAEEARRAVSYTRYPPEGIRGVAGLHRGSRYSTIPGYLPNCASPCRSRRWRPSSSCRRSPPCRASTRSSSARPTWQRRWACSGTSGTRRSRTS